MLSAFSKRPAFSELSIRLSSILKDSGCVVRLGSSVMGAGMAVWGHILATVVVEEFKPGDNYVLSQAFCVMNGDSREVDWQQLSFTGCALAYCLPKCKRWGLSPWVEPSPPITWQPDQPVLLVDKAGPAWYIRWHCSHLDLLFRGRTSHEGYQPLPNESPVVWEYKSLLGERSG